MKIFIGIVQFNKSGLLREQINRIKRYLLLAREDILNISIGDNSTIHEERRVNKFICDELGARYLNYDMSDGDPSMHHSMALNALYQTSMEEENDFSLFIDHDTFLFAPTNIAYDCRDKHFAGTGQAKIGQMYLHPNTILINNKFVPRQVVDFRPCPGMDTGGRLAEYIGTLKTSDILHLKFEYGDFNYEGTNDIYEIIGGSFMHFIKGSNWNGNPKATQREEELLKELQKISK
jgi:hypothetical protein